MLHFKRITQTFTRVAAALIAVSTLALAGCGDLDRSVMGTSDGNHTNETMGAQPAGYLVFSQRAAVRAAKKVKVDVASGLFTYQDSEWFEANKNEKLEVEFEDYGDKKAIRVDKATFQVKKNSIDYSNLTPEQQEAYVLRDDGGDKFECNIEMAVSTGFTLEEVVVAFGPSGLKFDPVANLEIQLKGDLKGLIPEGKTIAYHIDGNGNITEVAMDVDIKAAGGKLKIEIPGFSRYGLDP